VAEIDIERATLAETDPLIEIHEEAARRLWSRGIRQWEPGTFPRDRLVACIKRGEVYIMSLDGESVGMAILEDAHEDTWGARPDDALYLHGLRVLRWAEEQVTIRRSRYQEKAMVLLPSGMEVNGPSALPIS
jgi:hypothetical protein